MPPKQDQTGLTEKDMRLLSLAWQCFETEPKVDMAKLANLTGYTIRSAPEMLRAVKKKLRAMVDPDGEGDVRPAPAKLGKGGAGRKRKADIDAENGGEKEVKKPRARGKKAGVVVKKEESEENEVGEKEGGEEEV